MSEKLPLKEVLGAVDLGSKDLWDSLDETQQKAIKSELWILNRYISNVKSSNKELQAYFVLTVNEYFNKHWVDLQKHPKLLWMLLCMCSWDNETIFYHEWIGFSKKKANKKAKLLLELYPNLNEDELKILARTMSDDEFKELARELGWQEKDVKAL